MKLKSGFVLIIILLFACNQPKENKHEKIISPAHTTDPSVLFFKNVRQPFYNTRELPDEYLMIFRENTFAGKYPALLIPAIHLNWRDDIAWIRLELTGPVKKNPIEILLQDIADSDQGILYLDTLAKDHFTQVKTISDHLSDNNRIFLINGVDTIAVLTEKQQINAFRITVRDFLRLIE